MPTQVLPEPEDVRSVLNSLLGRDVTVARTTASSVALDAKTVVGCYEREDGKIGGLVVSDLAVAAFGGAALALMPVGVAKENVADGVIEDNLLENFQEVLNVGVQWFTGKGNPRVVLAEVYADGNKVPDDVKLVMAAPNDRADFEVEIAGYGGGTMRFLAMDF